MTNCSITFRRWAGGISILMGIMSGVIILSWVQGSTDHYALSISNRTKNSLGVGYFPFSKRTPDSATEVCGPDLTVMRPPVAFLLSIIK